MLKFIIHSTIKDDEIRQNKLIQHFSLVTLSFKGKEFFFCSVCNERQISPRVKLKIQVALVICSIFIRDFAYLWSKKVHQTSLLLIRDILSKLGIRINLSGLFKPYSAPLLFADSLFAIVLLNVSTADYEGRL